MMTEQEMEALLSQANNAIVGVNRATGGPQLTPVWYAWDGATFLFCTTKDRAKYWNIQRHPDISLIVDDLQTHKYVVAYGRAEVIEQDVGEGARPILQKYVPADQLEESVKQINDNPARVLVVLRPEKIISR
jgi:PPOX class probable F420-dependent enzyme